MTGVLIKGEIWTQTCTERRQGCGGTGRRLILLVQILLWDPLSQGVSHLIAHQQSHFLKIMLSLDKTPKTQRGESHSSPHHAPPSHSSPPSLPCSLPGSALLSEAAPDNLRALSVFVNILGVPQILKLPWDLPSTRYIFCIYPTILETGSP